MNKDAIIMSKRHILRKQKILELYGGSVPHDELAMVSGDWHGTESA